MTLINDSLEGVKASLLVAIKNQLVETYPSLFGDYKTGRDDNYTKVYWADTIRFRPKYPCCTLTPIRDTSEGYDETIYYKGEQGGLVKRVITRSFLTVAIDVYDMGDEHLGKTSLQADNFAHKVARQLRKYFNGDDKLEWFSGNDYYPNQIGITVDKDVRAILDWSETDTIFRYTFDITLGWDDVNDVLIDKAEGVVIDSTVDGKDLERVIVKLDKK